MRRGRELWSFATLRLLFHRERPVVTVQRGVVLPSQHTAVLLQRRRVARHHVAADGVPPLPRLPVGRRHPHHRVVGGVGVDGDDATAASDATRVTAHATVPVGGDAVVGRLGAVGAAAGGGAATLHGGAAVALLLGHCHHLQGASKCQEGEHIRWFSSHLESVWRRI